MAFRSDTATDTLGRVLDALASNWKALPLDEQAQLETLIRAHGPQIADRQTDRFNVVGGVIALLDALWQLQGRLPAAAVQALQAGQTDEVAFRSLATVPDAVREELLSRMVRIADFRVFDDPKRLAAEVDDLVSRNQDRLLDGPGAASRRSERTRWQQLHQEYSQGGDPSAYLRKVEVLLADYPAVQQLIETHKRWTPGPTMRGGLEAAGTPKGLAEVAFGQSDTGATSPGANAVEEVTRYANVNFPGTVLITQDDVPLIVHVAGQHAAWSRGTADQTRVALKPSDLTVFLHADGFTIKAGIGGSGDPDNPAVRTVKVERERDCAPLVFFLKPETPGPKTISLDFRQFGRSIFAFSFPAEVVVDAQRLTEIANVAGADIRMVSPARGEKAPPPDIELRVIYAEGDKTLTYILHSPTTGDYNFKAVGKVTLGVDPETFMRPIFDKLNSLARQSVETRDASATEQARLQIEMIGQELFEKLFAETSFKREEYAKLRQKYAGKGLLITSNDRWIPWEMVRPYHDVDGVEVYNDPPLCETFQVARWFEGRGTPDQLMLQHGVWVAPPDNLQAAQKETDYFTDLHRRAWQVVLAGPLRTVADVHERFLAGDTQFFHFACHGNFSAENADSSKLKLADDFLTPSQVTGGRAAGLRRAKPVIFLNACHSGRVGAGLTYLGGWAEAFYLAGASVFIGSLWEINDALASQFSREFYDRLWGVGAFEGNPQPLGQAFHEARLAIKQADPANPTWLAYLLYGDPYGQVVLGDKAPA